PLTFLHFLFFTYTATTEIYTLSLHDSLPIYLDAVAEAARGRDVTIVCAGFKGRFALDDAYCAGRISARLDGKRTDAALSSELVADRKSTRLNSSHSQISYAVFCLKKKKKKKM